jgi:hypothetical protein
VGTPNRIRDSADGRLSPPRNSSRSWFVDPTDIKRVQQPVDTRMVDVSLSIAERLVPIAGLLFVSAFLFYGLPEVTRGRTPSVRGWLWFCLWSAIVILLLLGLPSDIFVAIGFTAAALIGGGLLIGIIDWLRSRASASRARSRARVQVREGPKALMGPDGMRQACWSRAAGG